MAELKCVVVTPERAVLDEPADFVVVPLYDGELGIAKDRLPLIGRLGFGELRITRGTQTLHYYVDGGFVQVRGNVCGGGLFVHAGVHGWDSGLWKVQ